MAITVLYKPVLIIAAILILAACANCNQRIHVDNRQPDWIELGENNFSVVNGEKDTWIWRNGVLFSSGKPTGVMRSTKSYTNFEMTVEWRHLRKAGNSGVLVWVSDDALKNLPPGQLPAQGIEVQILEHDFKRQWEAQGNSSEWFTTHGDIFPVGSSRLTPFRPTSPNGIRSFPRKNTTHGVNQWNHYYIRCLNGEIRLWVNGTEVSGGHRAEPRSGYIALAIEGSPIEFRNIRIRELP